MAVTKLQKHAIAKQLADDVASQKAVVILTTKDTTTTLNATKNTEFRKTCYDNGVSVQVVKNTLISLTFPEVKDLTGQTFLAYLTDGTNGDEIKAPKAVVDQIEGDFKDYFSVLGSVVNGEFYDKAATVQLSKVPSFDQSMAMVAGTLNQITAKIAIAIKEVAAGLARGVKAAKEVA
jgi:large subunit ribosomal protein L10